MIDYDKLAKMAVEAKDLAYAPYSGFHVGAALLGKSGKIYTGVNVESAAYSPSNCAERTAFFKAVSEGEREFVAIAVAGSKPGTEPAFAYPCGVCRQVMNEFVDGETFEIIVTRTATDYKVHTLNDILPFGFGPKDLEG